MNTTKNKKEYYALGISLFMLCCVIVIFYQLFVWPLQESAAPPETVSVENDSNTPYLNLVPPNAMTENVSAPQKVVDAVKKMVSEIKTKKGRVYVFKSGYRYIPNPDNKTISTMDSEIKELTGGNECDPGGGYANCSILRNTTEYRFDFDLRREYIYYLVPVSVGLVSTTSSSKGFTVNAFFNNAWVEKPFTMIGDSGEEVPYTLYGFPAEDAESLANPLSGFYSVAAP